MRRTQNAATLKRTWLRAHAPERLLGAVLALVSWPKVSHSAEATPAGPRPVEGIMDNSFLVEEAYNQEAGVVQHIFNAFYGWDRQAGPDDKSWTLAFTQEWPLGSQRHQFSYTVPYNFADSGGQSQNGFGDMLMNYRYQAYFDEQHLRAFAPRLSLVLPTGDGDRGFGEDTVGLQSNLPFSSAWGDRWSTHFNAGLTWLPDAASTSGSDSWNYHLGASVIYAASRDVNYLVEWVGIWEQVSASGGGLKHEFPSVISPGVRRAFNFANETQLVLGVAAPIGLTGSAPDYGVFLYLSFEHFFLKRK